MMGYSMEGELIFLGVLIVIFIASFWGLVIKIKKQYRRDQELTERIATIGATPSQLSDAEDGQYFHGQVGYPNAPPSYTEIYFEPPPKYEDIVKDINFKMPVPVHQFVRN